MRRDGRGKAGGGESDEMHGECRVEILDSWMRGRTEQQRGWRRTNLRTTKLLPSYTGKRLSC